MRGYSIISKALRITGSLKRQDRRMFLKFHCPYQIQDAFESSLVGFFRELGFTVIPLHEAYNLGIYRTNSSLKRNIGKGKTGLLKEEYIAELKQSTTPAAERILEYLKEKEDYPSSIVKKLNIKKVTVFYNIRRLLKLNKIEVSKQLGNIKTYKIKEVTE